MCFITVFLQMDRVALLFCGLGEGYLRCSLVSGFSLQKALVNIVSVLDFFTSENMEAVSEDIPTMKCSKVWCSLALLGTCTGA